MTPPGATEAGKGAGAASPPAAFGRLQTLRRRTDFLQAGRGRRQGASGLVLLARRREGADIDPDVIRVGYTCSRRLGNAVTRNRARRRLREAARLVLPRDGRPGWDYVLIGRQGATAERRFDDLLADLREALAGVHGE